MIDTAANVALAAALVIHVFAAIFSFLATFFLICCKLSAAKREERNFEAAVANGQGGVGTVSSSSVRVVVELTRRADRAVSLWAAADALAQSLPLVVLGPVRRQVRARDHGHPLSSGIFASACCTTCVVSGVAAIFWPYGSMH